VARGELTGSNFTEFRLLGSTAIERIRAARVENGSPAADSLGSAHRLAARSAVGFAPGCGTGTAESNASV